MKYSVVLALVVLTLILVIGYTQSIQPQETLSPQTTIIPTITRTSIPITESTMGSPSPTQPPAGKPSGLLTVRYLDVGQGDSMLIQTPSGKNMLIDAGPTDAGSTVTSDLKGLGINTLDIVLATHPPHAS